LYDALLLNSSRIGHGFALRNHPKLRQRVREAGVAIEICILSNQVLGLIDDMRNHPVVSFIAEGLPLVLSSDDPGFWGAQAVSYDWWAAFVVASESCAGIGLLKQLALNSLTHAMVDESRRAELMSEWKSRWEVYIDWLLEQGAAGLS